MTILKKCQFYRGCESSSTGLGIGYCDLDGNQVVCDGDIHFCEKPDVLKKYLIDHEKKEGTSGWEKKRNVTLSEGQKA